MSKLAQAAHSSTFKPVLVRSLNIDPDAQRKFAPAWVKARISKFDVDQLGFIVVNKRRNDKFYIVDGQHRVELMRAVGWDDQNVPAEVFEGMNQAQEAELFLARNDRKAVRLYDKFRVAITSGDPQAIDIDKIVKAHGLIISDQAVNGRIVAVDSLQRVYLGGGIASAKEGPKALANSLAVLVQAWGNQVSAVNGKIIQGLGLVELRYDGALDQKALAAKLAPIPGGAPGLLGRGKSMQETRGKPLHHCIAAIIVDIYNKGRRVGKLDAWES